MFFGMANNTNVCEYNILTLAYLGDAVIELMAREKLVARGNSSPGALHRQAKKYVSAHCQSIAAAKLLQHFTPDEATIYRRARNAKSASIPKNALVSEHSKSTAVEAVFGYLYLTGGVERLKQLFDMMEQAQSKESEG